MARITDAGLEELRYRRQFVLGPRHAPRGPGWRRYELPGGLTLGACPDLPVTQYDGAGLHLTLVGYMLDPRAPGLADPEILAALTDGGRLMDLPRRTAQLGGRWALIACQDSAGIVFTDPCGLRQVHYSDPSHTEFWCGTQPQGIAAQLALDVSASGREFLQSDFVARTPEYWWPNGTSPYAGVRRLLPNHYLELPSRAVRRFWPEGRLTPVDLATGVASCAAILTGLLEAAAQRYSLALPLTAGYESRLLLAAARDVAPDLYCYTLRFPGYSRRHADLRMARRVTRRLGLQHHVLRCPPKMSGPFAEAYRESIAPDRPTSGAIAQGVFMHYPRGRVCVVGHGGEIGRCAYYNRPDRYPAVTDLETIARYSQMTGNRFALRELDAWLDDARQVESQSGLRVLDLMYWEQRVGNWAAAGEAEWDIVHERVPPYSCRELLTTMLGVDASLRQAPDYQLQVEIMRRLWPQVLSVPFNPEAPTLRDRLRSLLQPELRQAYRSQ